MKSTAPLKTRKLYPNHSFTSSDATAVAAGARGIMWLLTATAVACLVIAAASMGLDGPRQAAPGLSGFIWEDRDDSPETGSTASGRQVAGFIWEDRDELQAPGKSAGYAGYLWEDRDDSRDQMLAGYLWEDRDDSRDKLLAGYLWETRSGVQEPEAGEPMLAEYLWETRDEAGADVSADYIVQGMDATAVIAAVQSAGAAVSEQLDIINAVSARLTPAQRQYLASHADVRLVHPDDLVETANIPTEDAAAPAPFSAKGAPQVQVDGNSVSWEIANLSDHSLRVAGMELDWPEGQVTGIRLNDQPLYEGELLQPGARLDANRIAGLPLSQGQVHTLTVEFSGEAVNDAAAYRIDIEFDDGSATSYQHNGVLPIQGLERNTFFPGLVRASNAHRQGITGKGVTVAVVDSGLWTEPEALLRDTAGNHRVLAYYDATEDREVDMDAFARGETDGVVDPYGHGTHIASVIANSNRSLDDKWGELYQGIAPDANLVIVRAFGDERRGSYVHAIRAIDYVIEHKDEYNIKVLNLSVSAKPQSAYWVDPLNQAVMRAWDAGIVVVAAAGNSGPDPMSVGVPGNVPYIITVGAMTDSYTPDFSGDDKLTSFSAAGPTHEGFAKPDLVAPGGHMIGYMDKEATLFNQHPDFYDGHQYFAMSGTSQAAAVVSGAAALMLQNDPNLTPEDIKCRLMSSAVPAAAADGKLAYSVLQQGSGLLDITAALNSEATGCANRGLDIAMDLMGSAHFMGPVRQDSDGEFYVELATGVKAHAGLEWQNEEPWKDAVAWNEAATVQEGMYWTESALSQAGMYWTENSLNQAGMYWTENSLNQEGMYWTENHLDQAGMYWTENFLRQAGMYWTENFLKQAGMYWTENALKQAGMYWTENALKQAGMYWTENALKQAGMYWTENALKQAGMYWTENALKQAGMYWTENALRQAGMYWTENALKQAGMYWTENALTQSGMYWTESALEQAGMYWTESALEQAGMYWTEAFVENASSTGGLAAARVVDNE